MTRLAVALLAALLFHALVLLWPGSAPPPPVQARIQVTLAQAATAGNAVAAQPDAGASTHVAPGAPASPSPPAPTSGTSNVPTRTQPATGQEALTQAADAPVPAHRNGRLDSWLTAVNQRLHAASRYPPRARLLGIDGTVSIQFRVTARGRVIDARIGASSGHALLDTATLDMLAALELPPPPPPLGEQVIHGQLRYALGEEPVPYGLGP